MNYKIPNHILDIIMPIVKVTPDLSPAKAIEKAIIEYYKIPNHILDIIMPIVKVTPDLSPAKAIEKAIIEYYKSHEDNVCQPKDSKK